MAIRDNYRAMSNSPATVGIEVVLCVALPLLLGRWLDARYETSPAFSVALFFLGCAAAGKGIYRSWKHMQRIAREEEAAEGNPAPMFPKEDDDPKSERTPKQTRDEER